MWSSNQAKVAHVWETEKAGTSEGEFRGKSLTISTDPSKEYKQVPLLFPVTQTNIGNWN